MTIMANSRKVVVINEGDYSNEESEEEIVKTEESSEEDEDSSDDEEIQVSERTTKIQTENDENDGDNDDSDSVNEDDDGDGNINAAWADSIAKILKTNKPKKKKTLVLSKAKKLTDARKEKPKPAGFQVETDAGEIKDEQLEVQEGENTVEKSSEPPRKKKKEILSVRKKPNILEKDRERKLAKIATKGVVQLFNAVKTQQKDIKTKLDEAGPLEVRRDKVLKSIDKRSFLDVLMGEKSQAVDKSEVVNNEREQRTTWNVLRDDFMMGAKMKDWDKELEGEEEVEMEVDHNMESE